MDKAEWHWIHDFFHGFGMKECIPDNEIVLEEYPGTESSIPCRVVKHKQPEKYIWLRETSRWLGITDLRGKTSEELYGIYEQLQPFREKEAERIRNLPPFKIPTKFTIPKINREYPKWW